MIHQIVITKERQETRFDPIVSLLRAEIQNYDSFQDSYMKAIVEDAKLIRENPNNARIVRRETIVYSRALSTRPEIEGMVIRQDAPLEKKSLIELMELFMVL